MTSCGHAHRSAGGLGNHGYATWFPCRATSVDSCGSTCTATSRIRCKATSKASEYPAPEPTLKGLSDLGSCPTTPRTLRTPREGSLPHQRRADARGRIQGPRRRPPPPRLNSAHLSIPLQPRCCQVFAADTRCPRRTRGKHCCSRPSFYSRRARGPTMKPDSEP